MRLALLTSAAALLFAPAAASANHAPGGLYNGT